MNNISAALWSEQARTAELRQRMQLIQYNQAAINSYQSTHSNPTKDTNNTPELIRHASKSALQALNAALATTPNKPHVLTNNIQLNQQHQQPIINQYSSPIRLSVPAPVSAPALALAPVPVQIPAPTPPPVSVSIPIITAIEPESVQSKSPIKSSNNNSDTVPATATVTVPDSNLLNLSPLCSSAVELLYQALINEQHSISLTRLLLSRLKFKEIFLQIPLNLDGSPLLGTPLSAVELFLLSNFHQLTRVGTLKLDYNNTNNTILQSPFPVVSESYLVKSSRQTIGFNTNKSKSKSNKTSNHQQQQPQHQQSIKPTTAVEEKTETKSSSSSAVIDVPIPSGISFWTESAAAATDLSVINESESELSQSNVAVSESTQTDQFQSVFINDKPDLANINPIQSIAASAAPIQSKSSTAAGLNYNYSLRLKLFEEPAMIELLQQKIFNFINNNN